MSLPVGTRLGPYEITGSLGVGGMGEVYRARDSRLGRDVAVKVLPPAFAQDADRRARFEREAQAIAALSHPNIVNVFDTGVHAEQMFVVMELLEGATLRERLAGGALPARKAVEYGLQIARGLAAAHDKGLIHRDLKPDNVFVLRDGQIKILDFGLARPTQRGNSGATETATAMTDPGTVLGTVGYMAPEQVRGQAVDARTDLFAFGAVLYEMLSGARAFQRDTAAETMTAILREDPPELTGTRADISPTLDRIIRHCLEKNPVERFQTARDVAFALGTLSGSASGSSATSSAMPAAPVSARSRWLRPLVATIVIAAAAAAGVWIDRRMMPAPASIAFERKTFDPMWVTSARFAPDGQTIIFSAATTGNLPELFAIRQGTFMPQAIGQKATHLLSISSKGELAVIVNAQLQHHRLFSGTLARMTLDGAPRAWLDNVREADWAPDGSNLAVIHHVGAEDRLEYPIGQLRYTATGYLSDPRVSPDGKQVAFFEHQVQDDDRGWVKLLTEKGDIKLLAGEYWGEEGVAWSPDGAQVLFSASMQGGDIEPLAVNVSGTPVVRQRVPSTGAMAVQDVAADGRVLIIADDYRDSIRALLPGRSEEQELPWLNLELEGMLFHDFRTLAFSDLSPSAGPNYQVATRELATGRVVRLGEGFGFGPSPDGRWVGASVVATGAVYAYPTGAGQPVHFDRGAVVQQTQNPHWLSDSRRVLYCGGEKNKPARCYVLHLDGSAPQAVTGDNVTGAWPTSDDKMLLGVTTTGDFVLATIGSDGTTPARGLTPADAVVGWSSDNRSVVVRAGHTVPARIERVDVFTGVRTFIRELMPPDHSGVTDVRLTQWLDGGRVYVYDYSRALDTIFVATERRGR